MQPLAVQGTATQFRFGSIPYYARPVSIMTAILVWLLLNHLLLLFMSLSPTGTEDI